MAPSRLSSAALWLFVVLATLNPVLCYPSVDRTNQLETKSVGKIDPRSAIYKFKLGVVGDSWASGVTYAFLNQYEKPTDTGCMRLGNAYGPLMQMDSKAWLDSVYELDFQFKGCSGSLLGDIVAGQNQLRQVGASSDPTVIIMTSGGNNAKFGEIVDACFYRANPEILKAGGYGPYWEDDPNGVGLCKIKLNEGTTYINNRNMDPDPEKHGLYYDLWATLDDVFKSDTATRASEFWFFITGYSHFFNVDTTDCDQMTFSPWPVTPIYGLPLVKQDLRKAINDGQEAFFQVYTDVVANYKLPSDKMHLSYVSVTEGFQGHRFCEAGFSLHDNYDYNCWTWNLQYYDSLKQQDVNGTTDTMFTAEDGTEAFYDPFPVNTTAAIDGENYSGPAQGGRPGWTLRSFHPKLDGHFAMKNAIVQAMRDAGVQGMTSA